MCVAYLWIVSRKFLAEFVGLLWPVFIACVWNGCCVDMLDCVLIYVDIWVFRYIDIDGCKLYACNIIIHDTEHKIWYVNVSYSIHTMKFCIAYARGHRIKWV